MGVEDQREEREVLDSIFPDEIQDISDTAYRVSITLEPPGIPAEDEEPLIILLSVSYPDAYPDIAPNLDITVPPNASKHPLLDITADKAQLLDALATTVEESLGMAMVFTLVTTLKDSAEVLMSDRARQEQEIVDVARRAKQEEENRKFQGEKVTRERFIEWRDNFKKETEERERVKRDEEEAELSKGRKIKVEEKKLTGRQLWERGLVGKIDEDLEADAMVDATEKLTVQA